MRVAAEEGLAKFNTAGLPSVAEAGVIVAGWSRIIIIDCSSSRSRSRENKNLDSAIVSAVVGTEIPVVAPAGTVCEVVV
jgi:hypothetical protein